MRIHIFLICTSLAVAAAQFQSCGQIEALDCSLFASGPVCGTDGINYANGCYFAKAQCNDKLLHVLHNGVCLPSEVSTTPVSIINGEEAVHDFFCTALSHITCGSEDQLVCASDGWTYKNYCEYDKQRCTHRDLFVVSFGSCSSSA